MSRRIVVGDIHGCYLTVRRLLDKQVKIQPDDEVYFLGDFIDRGPLSRDVLEYIINLKWEGFRIFPVRGNHEDMFSNALKDESMISVWYKNGAEETLRSFEIPTESISDLRGLNLIPDRYIHFINSLPYYYLLDDYIIVHAGLNFRSENVFEDYDSMLWIREMKYDGSKVGNKSIIHGHTPMPVVSIKNSLRKKHSKIINLDAGCTYKDLPGYGNLIAMDLDTRELFIQENIEEN